MATTYQSESILRDHPASSSSVTRTVHESRVLSSSSADLPFSYRTSITPRNVIIQRTSYGGLGGAAGGSSSRSMSIQRQSQYGSLSGIPAGAYATVTTTGVTAVKDAREREKKDMQDLNERFASYIEKVRFLEAQNRRLADELEKLKSKWGKETTAVKAMYQAELEEARRLLDGADKEKARLEIRVASLEEQLEEFRHRLDEANRLLIEERERNERLGQQLSTYEAEVNPLKRHIETLLRDKEKDKQTIAKLQEALNRTRVDLDNETLLHVDAENRRQTLEEELEFLKAIHEQELKELAALAYRDTTAENREFWKNEMGQALREIQQMYEEKLEGMKGELETFYSLKIQEFRTGATRQNMEASHAKEESKTLRTQLTDTREKLNGYEARLAALMRELDDLRRSKEDRERELEGENNEYKVEISKLRAELEAILRELQHIMDTKLGLELEIAAYRKLLEGEENRVGLRQIVETVGYGGGGASSEQVRQSYKYTESSSSSSAAGGVSGGGFAGGYGGGYGGGGFSSSVSTSGVSGLDASTRTSQVVKGEMSAKTTYQRSAKGPVAIAECSADGKVIVIENTGRKDEELTGWRIRRNIDGLDRADFVFDSFVIAPISKIRVWAKGSRPLGAPPTDLEYFDSSWGVGSSIVTKLINAHGEDRATHTQKTTYS